MTDLKNKELVPEELENIGSESELKILLGLLHEKADVIVYGYGAFNPSFDGFLMDNPNKPTPVGTELPDDIFYVVTGYKIKPKIEPGITLIKG